jgi:uncharacterized protein DUF6896
MNELSDIQKAVLTLIQQFVERQKLVVQIVTELCPELLAIATGQLPTDKLLELMELFVSKPQIGYWGNHDEWRYFFHGGGCLLTHITTQEPIEWDAPILERFDRYWLVNWMEWSLTQKKEGEIIANLVSDTDKNSLCMFVFDVLNQLEIMGAIVSDKYQAKYMLKWLT